MSKRKRKPDNFNGTQEEFEEIKKKLADLAHAQFAASSRGDLDELDKLEKEYEKLADKFMRFTEQDA